MRLSWLWERAHWQSVLGWRAHWRWALLSLGWAELIELSQYFLLDVLSSLSSLSLFPRVSWAHWALSVSFLACELSQSSLFDELSLTVDMRLHLLVLTSGLWLALITLRKEVTIFADQRWTNGTCIRQDGAATGVELSHSFLFHSFKIYTCWYDLFFLNSLNNVKSQRLHCKHFVVSERKSYTSSVSPANWW